MNGGLQAPTALPPRKEPLVSIEQEAGQAQVLVWMQWRRKKFCPCHKADPGYPASQYTELLWPITMHRVLNILGKTFQSHDTHIYVGVQQGTVLAISMV